MINEAVDIVMQDYTEILKYILTEQVN